MQGPVHSAIEEKLNEQLKPQSLEIRNDSSLHAHHHAMVIQGGGNGETHFAVTAISDHFKGMLQIQRHRFVNRLLNHEFEHNGLHALSLRLYTPEEAERIKK
ncbi:bola-like protein [Wallemia mellicola CBS 633.66]|uniref:Bola-like protein n=1 Tax=Wallemia mellicola (strain ATCC MYA-4683 / CBS 633.66) TaxID=671144 RepID=I4YJL5_WALMC|nr:bola-like protein [Wallemia mellicola CBS 633.66]EIM24157.1 bola-like protein [Wallemia mellicola CBS 633.66]|eukprot:XP_006955980.1 bola-like protein [Wallemia mellicola CBS 633.66]